MRAVLAAVALFVLAGCISVGVGGDVPRQAHYRLHDDGVATPRRAEPLVPALLIQAMPADATADTLSIAFSPRANEFAFYQLASWTERPVRQLPRLLQQRLQARGVAAAVGVIGDPLRSDWLLTIAVDTLHHDVGVAPGQARVALTVELFDRRDRRRVAHRSFEAAVPTASADSAAAAAAMSVAVTRTFDAVVPWLESELAAAATKAP